MLKNIINTFFTRIFASLANLAIAIIISHVYGAEIKGEQGLILTTITLVTLLTAIIGSGSVIYFTPRLKTVHILLPSYIWNILVCLLVYILLLQTELIPATYVKHTVILACVLTVTHIHSGILTGIEKIRQSNFAFLMNTFFVLLSLLFFVFIRKLDTVMAYVYALYIGYGIHLLVSIFLVGINWKIRLRHIAPENSSFRAGLLGLLRFGFLNQLDVIAQMLSFRLSYYFIDHYLSKAAVGIYSNAISIIESIWLISRSIAMVLNARIVNSKDPEYSVAITLKLLKVSFILVFAALTVLLAIPASFYQFIFGEEFGAVRTVMIAISPGVLLFSTSFILSALFAGTGKYVYNTIASITGLSITLLLAFLLIPPLGLIGAGITASVAYIFAVGVKVYFLFTRYNTRLTAFRIDIHEFREFFQLLRPSHRDEN